MRYCYMPFIVVSVLVAIGTSQVNFTSSNLPIIVIDTKGEPINDTLKVTADMYIIYNGPGKRNSVNDTSYSYKGNIGVEFRGASSQFMYPKKHVAFETRDSEGENLNVSLLGMPVENDWILYAPYADKTFMRNVLAYKISNDLGMYASRTQFCELVFNGYYQGIYVLMEKIKRDKNRVDLASLGPEEISGQDVSGGYIIKIDKLAGEDVGGWYSEFPPYPQSTAQIFYQYHYPKNRDIVDPQREYIQNYIYNFELNMQTSNFSGNGQPYNELIDITSFIDFFILNEISKNIDGYRLSTFLHKDKDSKDTRLRMGPIWDFNIAFGGADYYSGFLNSGWQVYINYEDQFVSWGDVYQIPFWWGNLMADSFFVDKIAQRWTALRNNILHIDRITQYVDSLATILNEAQIRNFQRWPILGKRVSPNKFIGQTYAEELWYLKRWISLRLNWIDSQFQDNELPTAPSAVKVISATNSSITLNWNRGYDNASLSGYDVYVDSVKLHSTSSNETRLTNLNEDSEYIIELKSRDFAGNVSRNNPWILVRTLPLTTENGGYPIKFELYQNFPNPFNPYTTIHYELPEEIKVSVVIYDFLGREIRVLVNNIEQSGSHSLTWNGKDDSGNDVSAGLYLYQIRAGGYVETRKMVLLK